MRQSSRTYAPIHDAIMTFVAEGKAHTRADLARLLSLAPSTISLYVEELIHKGDLEEAGEVPSTGGRKGRRLRIKNDTHIYLVADLGTTHTRYGLAGTNGNLQEKRTESLPLRSGPESTLPRLVQLFTEILTQTHNQEKLAGIVIGLPAPIDHSGGCVHSASRIPQWNGFPLASWLSECFSVPTFIENDANIIALGEHTSHTQLHHSFTVKAGSALGVGIVVDGRIYRGGTGAAGDISHVRHEEYGNTLCLCGNYGCLETVVTAEALGEKWHQMGGKNSQADSLIQAAQDSDPLATHLLREAGEHLGNAVCSLASFFNPEGIFLAGKLSRVDVFVAAVRSCLYGGCHPLVTKNLMIDRSASGFDAGIRGAAALACTMFNHTPYLSSHLTY
ncbi:ROK family transcriptional regulator [Schaalia sp. lx-100]|uniref:ROK family transcriptional regulator n=1 Tax=Schaalia sp. lx-100 TaxID=2899081 RepID=UPI001E575AE4|nr:ROK family protein [Schaalia sp. lx-100]MCD4557416.1 ROK family protein [Schaalia sp. lx-100]